MNEGLTARRGGNSGNIIRYVRAAVLSFLVLSALLSQPHARRRAVSALFDATLPDTAAAVAASSPWAPEETPVVQYFSDVVSEERTGQNPLYDRTVAQDGSGKWRFGTFVLHNPGSGGFTLQLIFANGGVMKHKSGKSIGLVDMVIIYRSGGTGKEIREMPLTDENYKGDGYVYELAFNSENENLQESYAMELWAALNPEDFGKARSGPYVETVRLVIDVNF